MNTIKPTGSTMPITVSRERYIAMLQAVHDVEPCHACRILAQKLGLPT